MFTLFRAANVFGIAICLLADAGAAEPPRLVHVAGHGVVTVTPDVIFIRLTLSTVDDDLLRVRKSSDEQARTILDLAKKHGAADSDFVVTQLNLSLDFNQQLHRQIYKVDRAVTISLNDFAGLDPLLADLLRQPNAKVAGIVFSSAGQQQLQAEARSRAVADARQQAGHLAKLLGLKLGKARDVRASGEKETPFVTSVTPVVGAVERRKPGDLAGLPPAVDRRAASEGRPLARVPIRLVALPAADVKPFALGLIETSADVEIDFELTE